MGIKKASSFVFTLIIAYPGSLLTRCLTTELLLPFRFSTFRLPSFRFPFSGLFLRHSAFSAGLPSFDFFLLVSASFRWLSAFQLLPSVFLPCGFFIPASAPQLLIEDRSLYPMLPNYYLLCFAPVLHSLINRISLVIHRIYA